MSSLPKIALRLLAGLLAASAAALAAAQTPGNTNPPTPATPGYTLRTSANLVIVDVTVKGADSHPLQNLKASDFALTEDGKPQQIRDFTEHSAAAELQLTQPAPPQPKLAPGIFTNFAPVRSDGPANVLLLDMLNTPLRDQQYAKQQILDYLKHAPAGTRMAIFGLAGQLSILQGFTSDPRLLEEALSRKNSLKASNLLNDPSGGGGGDNANATAVSDLLTDVGTGPDVLAAIANAQQFESETQNFQLVRRAQLTLDALNQIARYLANIPGRKNLIWFSGAFPVSILPDPSLNNGFASMAGQEEEFRETVALLTKDQIALYPVDARGLMTTGTITAASSSSKYARDYTALGKDLAKFDASTASENETMLEAARETGGEAFINTNGLTAAVGKAISDGANYYTLTYAPSNHREDGQYRRIALTLPGRPATLAYRRGYYADKSDAHAARVSDAAATEKQAERSLITRTMVRGAPTPSQILFTMRVLPATGVPEQSAVPGNELTAGNPEVKPPFLRFAIDCAVSQQELSFVKHQGNWKGDFEFIVFLYNSDGSLLNRAGSIVHAELTPARYQAFLRQPFAYSQDISAPERSGLFVRVAVHDLNDDHVGAVEVPLDAVRKLAPISPPATH